MYNRTYSIRDKLDAGKFFSQQAVVKTIDFKPFLDAHGEPWRYSQTMCIVGGVEHVVVTTGGSSAEITMLGHASEEDLAVIARHIEYAGGRLFDGRHRINGTNKPKDIRAKDTQ